MGGAPSVGNGGACRDAGCLHPRDQAREHGFFAAMQVIGATGVDDETVRRIGCDDGCVAQRPEGEAIERRRVFRRLELDVDKTGNENLRLSRGGVERQDLAAAALPAEQHDRRISRWRRRSEIAAQAIGGPGRQIERDDPFHHRIPLQSRRFPLP